MRKRIITQAEQPGPSPDSWIDLERVADVEITSEDSEHPIEQAVLPPGGRGWRAAGPGPQTIRLLFGEAQSIRLIELEFNEPDVERTQEFTIGWASEPGGPLAEVVRQQWNFSPNGATREVEQLRVDLPGVAVLELTVTPDVAGGQARASLARLRLA